MSDRGSRADQLLDAFLEDLGSGPVPSSLSNHVARRIRDERPARQHWLGGRLGLAAALVVVAVLVGVGGLVAGPKRGPSAAAASPSSAPSPAWRVDLNTAGGGRAIPVDIIDPGGVLTGAAAVPVAVGIPTDNEVVQGTDPNSIVVRFGWGTCYTGGTMVVAPDRSSIAFQPHAIGPSCAGGPMAAAIDLSFRDQIDPSDVAFMVGSPDPTSPDSTPSSLPSRTPAPTPSGTTAAVETPAIAPNRFEVTLDPTGPARLPVLVLDSSLGITAQPLEMGRNFTGNGDVEITQGSTPDSVVVGWVGGACDELTQIEVDAARTTITLGTVKLPGGCDAIGIDRAVQLVFRDPTDAASLHGQAGKAPDIAAGMIPREVWFSDAEHGSVAGWNQATGVAVLAGTFDAGTTWTTQALGWGGVVGLGAVIGQDMVERPVVALVCAPAGNGGATQPGCTPGVYRRDGATGWVLLAAQVPLAIATRDNTIAVLVEGETLPNASYPYPPADLLLSHDEGTTWSKAASPCGTIPMESSDVTFDAEVRPVVLCGATDATGAPQRQLEQAAKPTLPTAWTTMPPLPGGQGMQLDFGSEGSGVAWSPMGAGGGAGGQLYLTQDGGRSWTPHPEIVDGADMVVESAVAFGARGSAMLVLSQKSSQLTLIISKDGVTFDFIGTYDEVRRPL